MYAQMVRMALVQENITPAAEKMLAETLMKLNLTEQHHKDVLLSLGISEESFESRKQHTASGAVPAPVGSSENDRDCVICCDEPVTHVVMDCMHLCLCAGCADHMSKSKHDCPICRGSIREVRRIFS